MSKVGSFTKLFNFFIVGSDFVRQELRAMVGARSTSNASAPQQQTTQVPDFDAIGFPFPE